MRQLDADWAHLVVVPLTASASRAAGHLADAHTLRGADAVHLAAFETLLAQSDDADVQFSSADAAQVRAARALG
jgi:predicted nucleic acid-binding protein